MSLSHSIYSDWKKKGWIIPQWIMLVEKISAEQQRAPSQHRKGNRQPAYNLVTTKMPKYTPDRSKTLQSSCVSLRKSFVFPELPRWVKCASSICTYSLWIPVSELFPYFWNYLHLQQLTNYSWAEISYLFLYPLTSSGVFEVVLAELIKNSHM